MKFVAVMGTPPEPQKRMTLFRLPNPMLAICPTCRILCQCNGTVKSADYIIQNRRCPECGQNVRLHIRRDHLSGEKE